MSVRIARVEVQACGPVSAFAEEFAPLTVVYGKNEMGKTTIVENIIASLFKDQKDRMYPSMRGEGFIGVSRVTVTGLGPKPVVFSPAKKEKLDHHICGDGVIPAGLFNLLFVRGAETGLMREEGGVGKSAIKALLSRQYLFDRIRNNLPREADYTEFSNGTITPQKKMGRYKDYETADAEMKNLLKLSGEYHEALSRTAYVRLLRKGKALEAEREVLIKAKRHYAFTLHRQIRDIDGRLSLVPETDIEGMDRDLRDYRRLKEERARRIKEKEEFRNAEVDAGWIDEARKIYMEYAAQPENRRLSRPLLAALLFILGSGISLFFSTAAVMVFLVLALAALLFLLFSTMVSRGNETPGFSAAAMDGIANKFREQFGEELRSLADFEPMKKQAEKRVWEKQKLEDVLDEISSRLQDLRSQIKAAASQMGLAEDAEETWQARLAELKHKRNLDLSTRNRCEGELKGLGVDLSDYCEEPVSRKYSKEELDRVEAQIASAADALKQEEGRLREIGIRLMAFIGERALGGGPEDVSEALAEKASEYRDRIRRALSEMIAGHVVKGIIVEVQKLEDERLEQYLNDGAVMEYLRKFTGKYERLRIEGEEILAEGEGGRYPLRDLSTGAREQVLLALRMGLARKLSGKESLFLVLDDAFQYSDWERRESLVEQAAAIVHEGWQVVYFTMDDDIRDRFAKAGKGLKAQFSLITI